MSLRKPASEALPPPFTRFSLPGLNLPLNFTPAAKKFHFPSQAEIPARGEGKDLFRTALNDDDVEGGYTKLPLVTLRELTMVGIMNAITDKKGWEVKVFDDTIAEKWKAEALATEGRDVTENMMNWVIAELRYKAKIFSETGTVSVFNGDVVKSDVAVPVSLKETLQSAVKKLEDIPEIYKDWHPGSDGKVLDLVHPSLFPLIYGRSRVLYDRLIGLDDCIRNCGNGETIPVHGDEETGFVLGSESRRAWGPWPNVIHSKPYSKYFQWLPCEVDISNQKRARITSYINNLHPQKHIELYTLIEEVIKNSIPLWNKTLTPLIESRHHHRIELKVLDFDPDPEDIPEEERPQKEPGETDNHFWDRIWEWERATRRAVIPDAGEFKLPEPHIDPITRKPSLGVDLHRDYGNRGLQIIVKLANIELSPEKPTYDGGSWHVEGAMNEHICATALYYYDSENITESRLAFRQQCTTSEADEVYYPQGVSEWLTEIFGCENDRPAVQEVGSVLCREGRLITFPNILQHRVQPFELQDKSKSGHRKILALFLVDPGIRIISTANVPPQQKEWWAEQVVQEMHGGKALEKLSTELKDKIFEDVEGFPIGMEEAKEVRGKLMEERKVYVGVQNRVFEYATFSLCEH